MKPDVSPWAIQANMRARRDREARKRQVALTIALIVLLAAFTCYAVHILRK